MLVSQVLCFKPLETYYTGNYTSDNGYNPIFDVKMGKIEKINGRFLGFAIGGDPHNPFLRLTPSFSPPQNP